MIHLEITSKCNARCPMCARNVQGGVVNPHLPISELRLDDIQRIFDFQTLKNLKKVYLCGNYGDPAMASECLEIIQYLRMQKPELNIGIHTNGGMRNEAWWSELAPLLSYCRFGIDGLEDTNHLYRQGVSWQKLIKNVKAYIKAGGHAEWDFLLFKHNEHLVETARALAYDLGFKKFQVKTTSRFFNSKSGTVAQNLAVKNLDGEVSHYIEPHDLIDYKNNMLESEYYKILNNFGTVQNYWDQAEIECKTNEENSVYISFDGYLFPCCWTANQIYTTRSEAKGSFSEILNRHQISLQELSLRKYSIEQILDSTFFKQILPASWSCKSIESGKLQVCAKTCGKNMKPFENQFVQK